MAGGPAARQTRPVKTHTLDQVDGFVVVDLDGAERAAGVVRLAPKILRDGAVLLARSATYQYASFGWQVSGASAGINSAPEARDAAVASFVAELTSTAGLAPVLLEPGKGLTDDDLAPLRTTDPRPEAFWTWRQRLVGLSAAVAADAVLGGLEGRTLAIEVLDEVGAAFVAEATAAGARVVAIGAGSGSVLAAEGFDPGAIAAAAAEHGAAAAAHLGPVQDGAWITAADADVLAIGSKAGVLDHRAAAGVSAAVLVPLGPVPVTARGLAVARRHGCAVLPDFLTTAGPAFAMWAEPDVAIEAVSPRIVEQIRGVMGEIADHPEGHLLGACERAEAFLATWQDALPFGRPLA